MVISVPLLVRIPVFTNNKRYIGQCNRNITTDIDKPNNKLMAFAVPVFYDVYTQS